MTSKVQSSGFFYGVCNNASWAVKTSVQKVADAVNAVGRAVYHTYDYIYARNPVTKKREFWFMPLPVEKLIGSVFYDSICSSCGGRSTKNGRLQKVEEVGQKLARVADRNDKLEFEFRLLDSTEVNAWALPNGKIAIYEGLLKEILNDDSVIKGYEDLTVEDKMAAVLSHEIVHSSARHSVRSMEKSILFQLVLILVKIFAIPLLMKQKNVDEVGISEEEKAKRLEESRKMKRLIDWVFDDLSSFALKIYQLSHSRSCEFEADKFGMHYMKKAGYNPRAAVWLQELFEYKHPSYKNHAVRYIADLFATHPSATDRLEANKKTLEELNTKSSEIVYRQNSKILEASAPVLFQPEKTCEASAPVEE